MWTAPCACACGSGTRTHARVRKCYASLRFGVCDCVQVLLVERACVRQIGTAIGRTEMPCRRFEMDFRFQVSIQCKSTSSSITKRGGGTSATEQTTGCSATESDPSGRGSKWPSTLRGVHVCTKIRFERASKNIKNGTLSFSRIPV